MTQVKIILRKSGVALIEWQAGTRPMRAWVTVNRLVEDSGSTAKVENPESGIPYGDDFGELIDELNVTPNDIDRELKRRGIWTIADLRARPNDAKGAIHAAYGNVMAQLIAAAKHYESTME